MYAWEHCARPNQHHNVQRDGAVSHFLTNTQSLLPLAQSPRQEIAVGSSTLGLSVISNCRVFNFVSACYENYATLLYRRFPDVVLSLDLTLGVTRATSR